MKNIWVLFIINKNIVFPDSLQFCKASLDDLAGNLEDKDFKHLMLEFPSDKLELFRKKDSYPYEWVDSYRKFIYPRLPPREAFYWTLDNGKRGKGDGHISNDQYSHLKNVWQEFGFKNFKDFHNHYLKRDVLLLVDVFEKFIDTCLKYYGLDPCHYFSSPGLSWDAMLKMTKVELEEVNEADIHLFIEGSMRGVICSASKRYSKANNEFCPDYDETKQKVYIKYLDINNLYTKAMNEYLPYGGFKWVKLNNKVINRILNESNNSLHDYFLEVDSEVPEELHNEHNDLLMAPEKIKVTEEILSPIQLKIKNEYHTKVGSTNKLMPNLLQKKNYIFHYRNLQYYLSKGWILTKVHKILEFKQSPWMKPYIDFNTERRIEATNEADKNLFKLLNNAVYGKTMENMRKRMKIRITKTPKDFLKYASRPTYIIHNIFDKNLVEIYQKKEVLKLNKPIYVRCVVLELSKLVMYNFFYYFSKQKCKNSIYYIWTVIVLLLKS